MTRSASLDRLAAGGLGRREWLRIGGLGCLGLSLPGLAAAVQPSPAGRGRAFGRARSCLIVFMSGGPPQHETFDPKPAAPVEVRGPFKPIASSAAGIQIGELLPHTARIVDRLTIVRSLTTGINAHASSGYSMLTGYPHPAGNRDVPAAPSDRPSLGAIAGALLPAGKLPFAAVTLPERIVNNPGVPWPGQNGGFMGSQWDPFLLSVVGGGTASVVGGGTASVVGGGTGAAGGGTAERDAAAARFRIDALSLPDDVPLERLAGRRGLLDQLTRQFAAAERPGASAVYARASQQAFDVLSAGPTRAAFDLEREPAALRDRYGRHKFGQSLLLGRRLIEAGVRLAQVNFPREPGDLTSGNPLWDTHSKNAERLKTALCPPFDQAFSALIGDMAERGLLDETLVVAMGEFGRSPKINSTGGRDHWGPCFSIALAGAGVPGGQVVGSTDRQGGAVASRPIRPDELAATIFHLLGIDGGGEFLDRQQRPHRIATAQPIPELLG